jgi:hypothetical protein
MCLMRREGKPDTLMMTGFVFLILANVAQLLFRHTPVLGEDLIDGVKGLLFGVAIGSLLLAIWRNARDGGAPKHS